MKRLMGIVLALVICMSFTAGYAVPVTVEGDAPRLTGECIQGSGTKAGDTAIVSWTEFNVLGTNSEGHYILYANDMVIKVTNDSVEYLFDGLDTSSLPNVDEIETLRRGSSGEAVVALQTALKKLGYLDGSADGSFGAQSEGAVSSFQAKFGLEETGVADGITQALAFSMVAEPQVIDSTVDPAKRYAAVADRIDGDISGLAEYGVKLSYDDIADEGYFYNGNSATYKVAAGNDLDAGAYTAKLILKLASGSGNTLTVVPALVIRAVGVRRPIMQTVILKSGDKRGDYPVTEMTNGLEGSSSFEEATVLLDADALALIAGAKDANELKMRVEGKYKSVDIIVSATELDRFSKLAQAAEAIK